MVIKSELDTDLGGWSERFELRRLVGRGGMGLVYEAWDHELDERVALKTLRYLSGRGVYLFKREFRALKDTRHPNLVRLGQLFRHGQEWCFTMEFVEGSTFLDYLSPSEAAEAGVDESVPSQVITGIQHSSMPRWKNSGAPESDAAFVHRIPNYEEAQVVHTLRQLLAGLRAIHRARRLHRDLKPDNVLVTGQGRVVLLDFGLFADLGAPDEETGLLEGRIGTAAYMAPEQGLSQELTPAADLYSVGVMLYEVLAGRLPFEGTALQMLARKATRAPCPPSKLVGCETPADLEALCLDLLARDPAERPSIEEALTRLGPPRPIEEPEQIAVPHPVKVPFVGRSRELGELEAAWEEVRGGATVATLVHGRPGVGKSALVAHFAERQRGEGVLTLAGRCYERESMPFKAFDGIIDGLSRHLRHLDPAEVAAWLPADAHYLVRLFPALEFVPAFEHVDEPVPEHLSPPEMRARAIEALREILGHLARRWDLLLLVDDLQWADPDSLVLLSDLLHPPRAPRLMVVATARYRSRLRIEEGLSKEQEVFEISLPGKSRRIDLEGLDRPDALALLESLAEVSSEMRRELVEEAKGHPLFLQELAKRWIERRAGASSAVNLQAALIERIEALPAMGRRLVEIASVAGTPLTIRVAAAAAGISGGQCRQLADELVHAQLLRYSHTSSTRRIESFHDRVREACLTRLTPGRRRALHLELVDALREQGLAEEAADAIVWHLVEAGERTAACAEARISADRAREALAFEHAARLYRLVIELGDFEGRQARRLHALRGECLSNAGHSVEAAEHFMIASEQSERGERLDLRRRAAQQFLTSGELDRGIDVLHRVLDDAGIAYPATTREALARIAHNRLMIFARIFASGTASVPAPRRPITAGDRMKLQVYCMVAERLQMVDSLRAFDFQSRMLRLALEVGDAPYIARGLAMTVPSLVSKGTRAGDRYALELSSLAEQICAKMPHDHETAMTVAIHRGLSSWLAGHFRWAEKILRPAERWFQEEAVGAQSQLNHVRIYWLYSLKMLGDIGRLRELVAQLDTDATRRGDRFMQCNLRREFNLVWLAADDPDEAERQLDSITWVETDEGVHNQERYELKARIELALYRDTVLEDFDGLEARIRHLSDQLVMRIQNTRTRVFWTWGRLLLARSAQLERRPAEDLARVEELVERLAEEHDRCHASLWGRLLQAGLHAVRGERRAALETLQAAVVYGEERDLGLHAAGAKLRLGHLVGGRRGRKLVDEARDWMMAHGVDHPERMARLFTAGFRTR